MAKVALVTGGSRGIGAAISKALKEAGYEVAANYAGNDEAAKAIADFLQLKDPLAILLGHEPSQTVDRMPA